MQLGAQTLAWIGMCFYDPLTGFFTLIALAFAAGSALATRLEVTKLSVTMSNAASWASSSVMSQLATLLVESAMLWLALRRYREK